MLSGRSGGKINLSSTNELVLQVVNNRSGENDETYLYGLPQGVEKAKVPVLSTVNWNGFFFDNAVQLRYAASYGQLAEGKNLCCFTAGNIYEKGPVIAYIDLMYSREGLDSKGIISDLQGPVLTAPSTAQNAEYFSTVVNFDYRVHPNWNLYLKGAYERAGIYKTNGHFEKGLIVRHGMRRLVWSISRCAIANCFSLPIFYIKDIIWPGVRRLGRHESGYPTRLHRVGLLYSGDSDTHNCPHAAR